MDILLTAVLIAILMLLIVVAYKIRFIDLRAGSASRDGAGFDDFLVENVLTLANEKFSSTQQVLDRQLELRNLTVSTQVQSQTEIIEKQITSMNAVLEKLTNSLVSLQSEKSSQHSELMTRLEKSDQTQSVLFEATQGIQKALANPKVRGTWGERSAEDLLNSLGLVEGVSYLRQQRLPNQNIPDFSFILPKGKQLHMDVKFPIDNYLKHIEAQVLSEKENFRKAFLKDVKLRIKELTTRGYINDNTVDFVLLFIPVESVFNYICEQSPEIIEYSLSTKIILCSPFTLFGVLSVIRKSSELFFVNEKTNSIVDIIREFSSEWQSFVENIALMEKHFLKTQDVLGQILGVRKSKMEKVLQKINELNNSNT